MLRVRPQELVEAIESRLPGILRELEATGTRAEWLGPIWSRSCRTGSQVNGRSPESKRVWPPSTRRRQETKASATRALAFYIGTIVYGQADVATIARELDEIELGAPGASLAARVSLARGQLARLEARFGDARRFMQQALEGFQALGMRELEASCDGELGVCELSAGDAAAALQWLLRGDAILAELGQHALRSTTQARIAQTHELLNDTGSARRAVELAERLSATEDVLNFAITHRVRARLALSEREPRASRSLGEQRGGLRPPHRHARGPRRRHARPRARARGGRPARRCRPRGARSAGALHGEGPPSGDGQGAGGVSPAPEPA